MAKQPKPKVEYEIPDRILVTTSRGVEVECLPIATEIEQQEANIRAGFTWPDCPQRTMRDVAGTEAHVDVTPEWLATAEATAEQKASYAEYKAKADAVESQFQAQLGTARARLIALRGVRVEPKLLAGWAEDHIWLGMTLPDNPRDLVLHFLLTEIIGNAAGDMLTIMSGIYRASGADPEVMDKLEASFRDTLGKRKGAGSNGNTPSPELEGQAAQETVVQLDRGPRLDRRRGGKGARAQAR
jgi:hypothetical protein